MDIYFIGLKSDISDEPFECPECGHPYDPSTEIHTQGEHDKRLKARESDKEA